MNLRPSGYEPDELPGCSTPRVLEGVIGLSRVALLEAGAVRPFDLEQAGGRQIEGVKVS